MNHEALEAAFVATVEALDRARKERDALRAEITALRRAIAKHKQRTWATHGPDSGSAPDRELWRVQP